MQASRVSGAQGRPQQAAVGEADPSAGGRGGRRRGRAPDGPTLAAVTSARRSGAVLSIPTPRTWQGRGPRGSGAQILALLSSPVARDFCSLGLVAPSSESGTEPGLCGALGAAPDIRWGSVCSGFGDDVSYVFCVVAPLDKRAGNSPPVTATEAPVLRRPQGLATVASGLLPPAPWVQCPSPCLADARGRQEWPAWSRCPAVQAALCMGFGQNQVRRLVQRKYLWAAPASVSASQLVADLLQEDDGGRAAEARGACPPLPHALPWHTVPTAQGPEGPSWWRGLWGVRAAWAPPEPDLARGAPWVGSHFPWGLLVCPTPPTAPVHVGPELPTPRREAQSEGATEPGEGGTPPPPRLRRGQDRLPCTLPGEGAPGLAPIQKVEVSGSGGWVWRSPGPEGAAGPPRSPGRPGAAAASAGGTDLQGLPGPPRVHRPCALRPPGLRGLRSCAAALPPLQGPHPQLRAHLPTLGQVSGPRAGLAWPQQAPPRVGLRGVSTCQGSDPSTPCLLPSFPWGASYLRGGQHCRGWEAAS